MLPQFPEFKDLDLSDQATFNDFLSKFPLEASEYTFTNLFAFSMAYNFRSSMLHNNLIILKDTAPVSMFCPVGHSGISNTLDETFGYLKKRTELPYLERVPESFVRAYLRDDENYIAEEDRDNFDYVYNVKDLIALKGKKFHDKKNKVNKFKSAYQYEYLTLTPGLIGECLAYEDYWCEVRDCEKEPGLEKEQCAVYRMLINFGPLGIKGGLIRINGKVAALTIGEKFLGDTMIIHVEKANSDIHGLYQVINQEFLMHEASDCEFVNREQDLGNPGLRRAKMSYNPARFVKKYKIRQIANR